jgi:hypothetical protein
LSTTNLTGTSQGSKIVLCGDRLAINCLSQGKAFLNVTPCGLVGGCKSFKETYSFQMHVFIKIKKIHIYGYNLKPEDKVL